MVMVREQPKLRNCMAVVREQSKLRQLKCAQLQVQMEMIFELRACDEESLASSDLRFASSSDVFNW